MEVISSGAKKASYSLDLPQLWSSTWSPADTIRVAPAWPTTSIILAHPVWLEPSAEFQPSSLWDWSSLIWGSLVKAKVKLSAWGVV